MSYSICAVAVTVTAGPGNIADEGVRQRVLGVPASGLAFRGLRRKHDASQHNRIRWRKQPTLSLPTQAAFVYELHSASGHEQRLVEPAQKLHPDQDFGRAELNNHGPVLLLAVQRSSPRRQ